MGVCDIGYPSNSSASAPPPPQKERNPARRDGEKNKAGRKGRRVIQHVSGIGADDQHRTKSRQQQDDPKQNQEGCQAAAPLGRRLVWRAVAPLAHGAGRRQVLTSHHSRTPKMIKPIRQGTPNSSP